MGTRQEVILTLRDLSSGSPMPHWAQCLERTQTRGRLGKSSDKVSVSILFFFFWPRRSSRGILVPRSGIEPEPPAEEARSPNRWTTGEGPSSLSLVVAICHRAESWAQTWGAQIYS